MGTHEIARDESRQTIEQDPEGSTRTLGTDSEAVWEAQEREKGRMNLPVKLRDWPPEYLELWNERAGIIEYMANVSRFTAEFRAEQDIRKQAHDRTREVA